jgi:trimeric autotransporter adhesin
MEVDAFIRQHGHLPGVPAAEEVKEQGIDMALMDAKLLEKIEELTLYVIELKKENEAIKAQLNSLKK